jgi:hypothetical protein
MLKNVNGGPPGGAGAGDPRASTINDKKRQRHPPWKVPKIGIQERTPSTVRNVDDGSLGGERVVDIRALTINAKKHRQ